MKVTYWSDYACPFCYIGVANLKKALASVCAGEENTIEMKAFELHPENPKEGTAVSMEEFAKKQGGSIESMRQRMSGVIRMAEEAGLKFSYEKMLKLNTVDAHRLTKFAMDKYPEKANALTERLYKAYFEEQQMISDHNVLADLAAEVGLDRAQAYDFLETDGFEMDVKLDEREAARYGIHSVPCFVFDDYYAINGAMSKEQFETALTQMKEDIAKRRMEEMMKNAQAAAGVTCGPDGCEPAEEPAKQE